MAGARQAGAQRAPPYAGGRRWVHVRELALWLRSLGFAALGFLTLVPLPIVVSAADTADGQGFAQWLGDGLGVSASSRSAARSPAGCCTTGCGAAWAPGAGTVAEAGLLAGSGFGGGRGPVLLGLGGHTSPSPQDRS
ncbi:hypothetical protein ACFXPI_14265 [Streptomyces sp. NPDC059104]|uniref:hypothetical protein n=1 Tax=Streptomyces sp. NPDC059104 TaxID=3346729 RepID=UPI0036B3FED4